MNAVGDDVIVNYSVVGSIVAAALDVVAVEGAAINGFSVVRDDGGWCDLVDFVMIIIIIQFICLLVVYI